VTSDQDPNPVNDDRGDERRVESVEHFCRRLISLAQLQLSVQVSGQDSLIKVNITGSDRPFLLANAASLLNGLEYIVNKAFHTGRGEPIEAIQFDSDHYRQHREAELTLLAKMASEKVISLRKPLSLQPMNPRERRIVHLALAGIEGVRSESNGTGEERSVTIYPAS